MLPIGKNVTGAREGLIGKSGKQDSTSANPALLPQL
jgi:hypothetical protein